MKAFIEYVTPDSEYYIHTPSRLAQDMFLYPLQCGLFTYLPGYYLKRDSFDSFLLMYIKKGDMKLELPEYSGYVSSNQFVLIDCYRPHSFPPNMVVNVFGAILTVLLLEAFMKILYPV